MDKTECLPVLQKYNALFLNQQHGRVKAAQYAQGGEHTSTEILSFCIVFANHSLPNAMLFCVLVRVVCIQKRRGWASIKAADNP
eukprot:3352172-Amphidinium_carterae.1